MFDPRPNDVAGKDFVVVVEVWNRNDYAVDTRHGFQGGTVLDIGANVGAFTVLASKAGARVLSFEPEPGNFERLKYHVDLNRCRNVELFSNAVGARDDELVTMIGGGGGARTTPFTPDELHDCAIRTVSLTRIIEENAPISFLKMDIEGGEFAIFDELDPAVLVNVHRISMEWHGPASPHLAHLHGDEFAGLVTKLADTGAVHTFGRPSKGGLLHWWRYALS